MSVTTCLRTTLSALLLVSVPSLAGAAVFGGAGGAGTR